MILGSVVGSLLTLVGMFVYYFYKERKNRMEILRSLHMELEHNSGLVSTILKKEGTP